MIIHQQQDRKETKMIISRKIASINYTVILEEDDMLNILAKDKTISMEADVGSWYLLGRRIFLDT